MHHTLQHSCDELPVVGIFLKSSFETKGTPP
jgi:hypothetical protein